MRAHMWATVASMALVAGSSTSIWGGVVVAWVACWIASEAARYKGPNKKPPSSRGGRPRNQREPVIEVPPCAPSREEFRLTLKGSPLQRVRKFKRVGSNLVVWLESTPVAVKIKAPSTTWSQWGRSVLVKVKDPSAWSRWVKSLVGPTPPRSKPSPAVPVRTKVIMPWDMERKVWKLSKIK